MPNPRESLPLSPGVAAIVFEPRAAIPEAGDYAGKTQNPAAHR